MPLPEIKLIERVRRASNQNVTRSRALPVGIGDDCAVLRLPAKHEALVTTDFTLEGIHFRREWHPPEVVGHRCLTRGLSDIAAMGGEPLAAFLSLALPADIPQRWVDAFMRGFLRLAHRFSVPLGGGDTAQSPAGVLADIVVLGSVPKGKAVLRSGARPGDRIYVTGRLGGSAAVLERLRLTPQKNLRPLDYPAHFYPTPRIELGRYLREHGLANAMIDLSDGLSTDLSHICQESAVGARIEAERIPCADNVRDLAVALHGGEDYELLFTSPQDRIPARILGVAVTCIGEIVRGRGLKISHRGKSKELLARGWQHFKG